jgi:biopolymer transport protein ExbD
MTPMIDVVLQLIIFFMFTSQLGELVRSPVDLPRAPGDAAALPAEPDVIVDIGPDGVCRVGGVAGSVDDVVAAARAAIARTGGEASAIVVSVRADRLAPARTFNALSRALATIGVRSCVLSTSAEEQNAGGARP